MQMLGQPDARPQWWREIDAAGIDAVVSVGRLSDDRGSIDAATLSIFSGNTRTASTVWRRSIWSKTWRRPSPTANAQCVNSGCVASTSSPASESAEAPATSINPDFYPIYETVAGLGVPVMVYTSPFAGPDPYLVNDMAPYERVLRQFPNLTLILGHGGYPRVQQVLDAAARHRNLYVCQDVYTFWPAGHLYRRAIERLQDQFVFGTSYPFSSMAEPVQETLKLPLSSSAMDKYLWANGSRLLGDALAPHAAGSLD